MSDMTVRVVRGEPGKAHPLKVPSDPYERLVWACERMDEHRHAIGDLAQIRKDAVRELRGQGVSVAQIAHRLGVSRQVIWKMAVS